MRKRLAVLPLAGRVSPEEHLSRMSDSEDVTQQTTLQSPTGWKSAKHLIPSALKPNLIFLNFLYLVQQYSFH